MKPRPTDPCRKPASGTSRVTRLRPWLALAMAAMTAAGMGQDGGKPGMTLKVAGVSEFRLVGAEWRVPVDSSALDREVAKLLGWHRAGVLVPLRVKVFAGHPLVKAIQKGPALSLIPADEPGVRLWLPVKQSNPRVLIERLPSGRMDLLDLPENSRLNLDFFQ